MLDSYDFVFFDWDNTLANTSDFWNIAYQKIAKKFGVTLTIEEVHSRYSALNSGKEVFEGDNSDTFWDAVGNEVTLLNQNVKLEDGALKVLNYLHLAGKKLSLISDAKESSIMAGLNANKLRNMFDVIIGRDNLLKTKPNPEGIMKAMSILNSTGSKSIMIGDKDIDILAGKSAGVDTALYLPKHHEIWWDFDEFRKSKPKYEIRSLIELIM